ncbi:MAG: S8 family serine peptidase [Rhodospirillales bacterium]|nr:S8 family serine peptidase [Rhodospirillales bacterium]
MKETVVLTFFISAVLSIFMMMTMSASVLAQERLGILHYDKSGKAIDYEIHELENIGRTGGPRTIEESSPNNNEPYNPDTQFEQGEVLVLDPPDTFSSDIRMLGFKIVETLKIESLDMEVTRLRIPSSTNVPTAIRILLSRFPNLLIDPNYIYKPDGDNIPLPKKLPRALFRWTDAPVSCGKGLRIGMIDSGVDVTHPALKGQDITVRSFYKKGSIPGPKDHGTAVAGILVGTPKWGGLLPGASLFAANFIEYNELGRKGGSAMNLLNAVKWLIARKVDIVNLSIAGANSKIMRRFIKRAHKEQLVMVASAGSWGRTDKPAYPAAFNDVVAVTALSLDGKIYRMANAGKYIDFSAPGVKVYTAALGGGGRLQSGASFATPFVTALMGLEILNGRARTHSQLYNILQNKAKDLGAPGRDNVFGWGFIWQPPDC